MKNADILDQAQEATNFMTDKAVEVIRQQAAPEQHPDFDGLHCVEEDCGVEIPGERLALGKVRCTECTSRRERLHRGPSVVW